MDRALGLRAEHDCAVFCFHALPYGHHSRPPLFLQKVDHTAIYYLIAGTYTPFLLIAIPTAKAQYLLIALWVIALLGTLFKFVFIHRFQKLSLAAYLAMGWLALLVMDDMQQYLSAQSLTFLIIGGLAYTVGALFYALKE